MAITTILKDQATLFCSKPRKQAVSYPDKLAFLLVLPSLILKHVQRVRQYPLRNPK